MLKTHHELWAVVVAVEGRERWLNNLDVYPFGVPRTEEPLLFGERAPARQHAGMVKRFVPGDSIAWTQRVKVTIDPIGEPEAPLPCAGS